MFITAVLFFCYFFSLLSFSLVSHPIYYCCLLVVNSLISCLICYEMLGFSWYSALFSLVYVGGVYILFVFVSVFNPNSSLVLYYSFGYFTTFLVWFMIMIVGGFVVYSVMNVELSEFLCVKPEGNFYVCMCLTLVFGFMMLSIIMSIKMNFYR